MTTLLRKPVAFAIPLALLCLCVGFLIGFFAHPHLTTWMLNRRYTALQMAHVGKAAPDVTTLTSDGRSWSLQDQRGKVVLVNFWATWCGPCVHELPALSELHRKFASRADFLMVGVSMDEERDLLTEFCKKNQVDWLQLQEPGKGWNNTFAKAIDVNSLPSTLIIDREGKIVGSNLTPQQAEVELSRILFDAPAGPSRK